KNDTGWMATPSTRSVVSESGNETLVQKRQDPCTQDESSGHGLPHEPQLLKSLFVSTQTLLQFVSPGEHWTSFGFVFVDGTQISCRCSGSSCPGPNWLLVKTLPTCRNPVPRIW